MPIDVAFVPTPPVRPASGPVRGILLSFGLTVFGASAMAAPAQAGADPQPFPQFDVAASCHERANYAFAATLGQADADQEFSLCAKQEAAMHDLARTLWAPSPARTRADCVDFAKGAYARLARCLDPSISAP